MRVIYASLFYAIVRYREFLFVGGKDRSCVRTVDHDVAVPGFNAALNKWLLNTSRPNPPEEISLLTATPPRHLPGPSTSAKRKSSGP